MWSVNNVAAGCLSKSKFNCISSIFFSESLAAASLTDQTIYIQSAVELLLTLLPLGFVT